MAKKKTEEPKENFDITKAMDELQCPNMFKAGLGYYIEINKLDIKNDAEFKKIVKQYASIGE